MPVMEGKCVLFKEFAGVDAFPLCVRTKDVDELVRTIYLISGSFGGINLEDIAAPRCFEVERKLKEICDIPVFHDDQHGTAVVVAGGAAQRAESCRQDDGDGKGGHQRRGKRGRGHWQAFDEPRRKRSDYGRSVPGIICEGMEGLNPAHEEMSRKTNPRHITGHAGRRDARGGCVHRRERAGRGDARDGREHERGRVRVPDGEPRAGNPSG